MTHRLVKVLRDVRDGFWLQPLVLLVVGVLLSLGLTSLDRWLIETARTTRWLEEASPGGARALLGAAAGALATTLAISMSMTMVTVQLASSQYTPRLIRRFLADGFMQRVLGAFLGTIAFLFMVLRSVRSAEEGASFVPMVSLASAVLLTLVCLALLVVFLHRTMRGMQASTIVAGIGRETTASILATTGSPGHLVAVPSGPTAVVRAEAPGYVQILDDAGIRAAVGALGTAICRDTSPGDFVIPGTPLVTLFGATVVDAQIENKVRECFTLGSERTAPDDLTFGVRQLVDMALKALSPGINDVTTAVMVVNELGVIGRAVARVHPVRDGWVCSNAKEAPPYLTRELCLERYLALAFEEVTHAATVQPRVLDRMLEILGTIASVEPAAEVQEVLYACEQRIRRHVKEPAWCPRVPLAADRET
ncbi:MAG: DUF2254 domain-containing protein [Deltaproteobacteria bacterium]|nr:DUF2254 domain-containing protein [Deltaproteobacteria bacterium]